VRIALLTATALAMLAGCRPASTGTQAPDLLHLLPTDWIPVNAEQPWTQINIDGDQDPEWLLLYTYDNASLDSANGPIGAVIYDPQQGTAFATGLDEKSTPYQAAGGYTAYRILPNYWQWADSGFVGPNELKAALSVLPVTRREQTEIPEEVDGSPDEAIIYAGNPRKAMTVIWWRSSFDGYGVANVYAAGGFSNQAYGSGNAENSPVVSLRGMNPFHDRSRLCQEILYTRTLAPDRDGETIPYRPAIRYLPSSLGIKFCARNARSAHPFYPEGVVLTYLLADRNDPGSLFHPEADATTIAATLNFETLESVNVLRAPLDVKFNAERFPLDVPVCVGLLADGGQQRWYLFNLRHSPPDLEERITDRLSIISVDTIPTPASSSGPDCSKLIPNGTPEKLTSP
jgi:hypothetical protein